MKIAVIAHLKHPIAEPFAGGLEAHTFQLASGFRDRGHDVVVFASTKSDPGLGMRPICDETDLDAFASSERHDAAFLEEHHAYLRLMLTLDDQNFDVVHNNSLHYLPIAMSLALRAPTVTTLHTPPLALLESSIRICGQSPGHFVAVSRKMQAVWGGVRKVEHVISNGIDLSRFAFQSEPDPDAYLVWSGRIVPEKGLHLAIRSARLVGMPLRFAGPISNVSYFEEKIAPELDASVRYMGHLAQRELSSLVGGARVSLCTPCWEEPYGLVVAEALAAGVPVAGFDCGALSEILDPSCGLLVPADNCEALAHAVRKAETLDRAACRRRAEEVCDGHRMIDTYENLYTRLLH